MADPKKSNPTAKDNEALDRDYDLQNGKRDMEGDASRAADSAGDRTSKAATSSGRNISGQRSQTDAEDGIGASTTGQAARDAGDGTGDTSRLRDNDDSPDLELESDLVDDEVEHE